MPIERETRDAVADKLASFLKQQRLVPLLLLTMNQENEIVLVTMDIFDDLDKAEMLALAQAKFAQALLPLVVDSGLPLH